MTKSEYLQALKRGLGQLSTCEREKQLDYYEELLNDMIEDGMTEQDAAARLGDPIALSMKILQDQSLFQLVKHKVRPKRGWTGAAVAALILGAPIWISVLIALLAVALSIYAVLGVLVLSLFAVVLAIGISGIAFLIGAVITMPATFPLSLLVLGGGFFLLGVGILAFLGSVAAAKWLLVMTRALYRWIKSLFIQKEVA